MKTSPIQALTKAETGIAGFDEVTSGGLPKGRATIVCGGPGCGKTLFAMQFLVHGVKQQGEPGVFVSFEEDAGELVQNVSSLGFDLPTLIASKHLVIDYVLVEKTEQPTSGQFDLDGLFLRLAFAIDSIGAKRVVLDTPESLFGDLAKPAEIRAELRRLFRWLKDRGQTVVITAEAGTESLTREGLEEYVSDCVVVLDQRMKDEAVTRRMRIVKYRGSSHSSNEFPFLIDDNGFSIVPITGSQLNQAAPMEHISTGVLGLDQMFGGDGPYRASSILLSGPAGTGKSTFAARFLEAACQRGERAIYFSFEESPETLVRDMKSVGIHLEPWVKKGLLKFECSRVTTSGLEMHVANMTKAIRAWKPSVAVIDPVSAFDAIAEPRQAKNMLTTMSDMLRAEGVTALMTYLSHQGAAVESTVLGISSSVDAWILLRDQEFQGARTRHVHVLKARGMRNSTDLREYRLTNAGIVLESASTTNVNEAPALNTRRL